MPLKILKYVLLSFLVLILILIGLLFYHFKSTQALGVGEYELAGWLWSDNYGWISLNLKNTLPGCTEFCGNYYSVKINTSNEVSGWGWSSNVGWVCFGSSCGGIAPGGGSAFARLDEVSGKLSGWAKVWSLGESGWLHLERGGLAGANPGEACYNCENVCVGPVYDEDTGEVIGCNQYDLQCKICFTRTYFDGQNQPDPDVESVIGGSGYFCSSCANCEPSGATELKRTVCASCSSCQLYGTGVDLSNGKILGWGWNGADDVNANGERVVGAGWVHFNPQQGGSIIVFPWLETQFGSIYTAKKLRQRAGGEQANATYCILAEDITSNIKTENCENIAKNKKGLVTDVKTGLLTGIEIYRNALGKIDFKGLTAVIKEIDGAKYNKYGYEVVNNLQPQLDSPVNWILNNSVYVRDGDYTINAELSFGNGDSAQAGSGLIIINGDLYINANIVYTNGGAPLPGNLKQLASAAWLVKGDVIVAPTVENIAGAFIILGRDGVSSCEISGYFDEAQDFPQYQKNGCGVFFSGESAQPLTVFGLIMARAFDFRRTFAELTQGAERIIYDGRLIANPPPGLKGFVEKLPVIRDFAF